MVTYAQVGDDQCLNLSWNSKWQHIRIEWSCNRVQFICTLCLEDTVSECIYFEYIPYLLSSFTNKYKKKNQQLDILSVCISCRNTTLFFVFSYIFNRKPQTLI